LLLILGYCLTGWSALAQQSVKITHGPILGRPTPTSMTVWLRTSRPGEFKVRYGESADQLVNETTAGSTSKDHDHTGIVTLEGLRPGTRYYYEPFVPGGEAGKSGSFKTLRDAAALVDAKLNPKGLYNFSFEFACGNNQKPTGGGGPALRTYDALLRQHRSEVDFAILNGDWLYEEKRDFPAADWRKDNGYSEDDAPDIVKLAPTICGVWENYKLYLDRAPNLAEWHRHVPTFYTADDHELVNDIYGSGTPGFKNRRAVFRDIALRAWFDYLAWANPVRWEHPAHFGTAALVAGGNVLTDANADFTKLPLSEMSNLHVHWGGPNAGIMKPEPDSSEADPNYNVYGIKEVTNATSLAIEPTAAATRESTYSIGRRCYGNFRVSNCEFFLLDTRTDRELHNVRTPAKPGLQMLGEHQEAWLTESMKQSEADFFFVVSSVNFMIPHIGSGGEVDNNAGDYGKDDAWTVFLDQRERLIEFWDGLGKRVFVLTGDLHNSFAIKITDNVWEFASGPHNSVNHAPASDEGGRPANGTFQYGPRPCEIRWSSYVMEDIPRLQRLFPHYCIVQINNVFDNPPEPGKERLIAYPKPHVIFRYHDGLTGQFRYAETIHAR
jgi:alkaline phosphatase D